VYMLLRVWYLALIDLCSWGRLHSVWGKSQGQVNGFYDWDRRCSWWGKSWGWRNSWA
jgi:hypothetical protein